MSSAVSAKTTTTKTTKENKAKAVVATVTVPAPVEVAAPAVPAKAAKAPKAKAAAPVAAPVEVAPTPTTNVVAATPTDSVVEEDVGASLQKSITELHEQLSALKTAASGAAAALKVIEKQAARVVKKADRRRKRKADAVAGAEPKPCIFTKPVKISDELCSFLAQPKNTEVSRSAVTKGVMAYARANNLMDKQTIKADGALRKLLTLNEGDSLTILNLQKFLRRHYIKAPVA